MVTTVEEAGTWTLMLSTEVMMQMHSADCSPTMGGDGEQVGGTAIGSASTWVTQTGVLWLTADAYDPPHRVSPLSDPTRLVIDVRQP